MSFFELSPNCLLMISFTYNLTSQDKKKKKITDGPFAKNWRKKKNQGWFIFKKKLCVLHGLKNVSDNWFVTFA